jgi:hypothetical protein
MRPARTRPSSLRLTGNNPARSSAGPARPLVASDRMARIRRTAVIADRDRGGRSWLNRSFASTPDSVARSCVGSALHDLKESKCIGIREHFPTEYCISSSGGMAAEPIGLAASPTQFSSFCKKPDDLSERGAILPEKLMATFEHAQGCSWDSSHHTLLG